MCLTVWNCQIHLYCNAGRPLVIHREGPLTKSQHDVYATLTTRMVQKWSRWMEFWRNAEHSGRSTTTKRTVVVQTKKEIEAFTTNSDIQHPHDSSKFEEKKKKKRRTKMNQKAKTGHQKMQSCRHLAAVAHQPASTRLYQLWNRTKKILEQQKSRWRNFRRGKIDGQGEAPATDSFPSSTTFSTRDMNLAYSMAVMASLSYWPFHKRPLPDNRSSFELLTLKNGNPQPLQKRRQRRRRRKRDQALGMALKGVSAALKQASPWLPKSRRNRQNKGSYRESWQTSIRDRLNKSEQQHPPHGDFSHHSGAVHLEYFLYNWYEPAPLGVNYHDTDLLVATSNNGETLILAFAGTDSVPDTVTNLQTFESVQHMGGLFQTVMNTSSKTGANTTRLEGSIHRGFLNAYSRTERGSILNLCDDSSINCTSTLPRESNLHRRYRHCVAESGFNDDTITTPSDVDFDQYDVVEAERRTTETSLRNNSESVATSKHKEESIVKKRGRRGCKIKHKKLMTILRDLVTDHLNNGRSVLLTGHSLGGSLATILALDVLMHFPKVPVDKLQLWTFGGAQVTDNKFLESALSLVPRLKNFLEQEPQRQWDRAIYPIYKARSQFHRFVTVSDDCQVDFISTVAQNVLSPDNEKNIHGKTARKIGGIVKGGSVVHLTEPHYLLTPDQYDSLDGRQEIETGAAKDLDPGATATPSLTSDRRPSSTRSSISAHATSNYLQGISRESKDHPLSTDFPSSVRTFLGESDYSVATQVN
ncbi:lipase class 3 [Nitzschia inconspicua]|uniref:Lipase class 3 n=1 Tax=Nitzschia inconspicua TaxID=303405 RepID=A0A9K3M5I3_9STRA|nr:lipase class 3 [Nitzschia inconspicua]